MKEDLSRETHGTAVGGDRGADRPVARRRAGRESARGAVAAREARRPAAPPARAPGLRKGFRPRRVQTAEGGLEVDIPQVRAAAEPFVSKLFPRGTKVLRTEP